MERGGAGGGGRGRLLPEHGGRYLAVAKGVETIPALAAVFGSWDSFADVSLYAGREVPFFKRALFAAATGGALCPAEIDSALWNRGGEPRYKAIPRPRSRNTAY